MEKKQEIIFGTNPYRLSGIHVRRAIILAAGMGNRLSPLTDNLPKCLVRVNGVPILVNALTQLADSGVNEVVIIVGYLSEKIRHRIGNYFRGMKISYVESDRYATTNNIYSLWLAREHLTEDVILLEADVYFERELLDHLLTTRGENQAALVRHQSGMSGSVVRLDDDASIANIIGTSGQGPDFEYENTFKTVNIYRLSGNFLRNCFLPCLNMAIEQGDVNNYYESVLNELCAHDSPAITAVHCDDVRWIEIDSPEDLEAANYLFASQEQRYEHISKLHGDYWRYDFVDHALLYNLYFPPQAVFNDFTNNLGAIVLNYPGGQDVLDELMGVLTNQPSQRLVVANGASELIKIIAGRLQRKLVVPVPSFNEWVNAVPEEMIKESLIGLPSLQLDVEKFASDAFESNADIAVVLNPNNPTSLAVAKPELIWLVKRLAENDIMLILDESFINFTETAQETTMEDELDRYQNLTIVKSLSKCYGIGGLRLGYLLTANIQFAEIVRKEIPIWNINGFGEAFLRLAPQYRKEFARSCDFVRSDRDALYRGLNTISGLTVYRPDANFILCRLPDDALSGPELTRKLFIEENILIKHCAGKTMPEADRYLRIASRTKPENRKLVEALRSLLTRG